MNQYLKPVAALMISTVPAVGGGIERTAHSIAILYESGNYVEFSGGWLNPSVSGRDLAIYGGRKTGQVAGDYTFFGLGYKHQFNDRLSGALIVEQPFGADIDYAAPGAVDGSVMLGRTGVSVNSTSYALMMRYKLNDNVALHGGLRASRADAAVDLSGFAYGPLSGYRVELDEAWGLGYSIGASYERPDIGARVSLTYNSPIEHDFDTSETLGAMPAVHSSTTVKTPKSWTLEAQTGIAPDTLLMGSIRWVEWSAFKVEPQLLMQMTGAGLVELDDATTYTLGVARKFNENWSGAITFLYEPKAGDDLVSPLAPTNGRKGVTLAAIYTQDRFKITGGVSYTKVGDADAETGTPDVARTGMRDNDYVAVGIKIGYRF